MARKSLTQRTKRTIVGAAKSSAIRVQRIAIKAASAAATAAAEAAVQAAMRSFAQESNPRAQKVTTSRKKTPRRKRR